MPRLNVDEPMVDELLAFAERFETLEAVVRGRLTAAGAPAIAAEEIVAVVHEQRARINQIAAQKSALLRVYDKRSRRVPLVQSRRASRRAPRRRRAASSARASRAGPAGSGDPHIDPPLAPASREAA